MNAWQVDTMWEASAAEEWERLHEPDPYRDLLIDASGDLKVAIQHLAKAMEWLEGGASLLAFSPMEDQLMSLVEEGNGVKLELEKMAENWQRGVRE